MADASSVNAGAPIGYVVTVSNTGVGTAKNVTVTDTLPTNAGLSWSIASTTGLWSCSISAGVLTCGGASFNLAGGASASVHITSPTTTATCGTVNNTASVTTSNAGSGQASASITVTCSAPTGQITPTQTTCQQFRDGRSPDLTAVNYTLDGNKIANTDPGVFFYYLKVTAPSATFDIHISQTNTQPAISLFHVQNDDPSGVVTYDGITCNKTSKATVTSVAPGDVVVHFTGATTGQVFIIGIKYSTKSIIGTTKPNPPSVTYTFQSPQVPNSADTLILQKKK